MLIVPGSRSDDGLQDAFNLRLQVIDPAVILQYMMGSGSLGVKRHLLSFAAIDLLDRPTAIFHQSLLAHLGWCIDEQYDITLFIKACFQQQWGINHQCNRALWSSIKLSCSHPFNHRMQQCLQSLKLLWIRKDVISHLGTIHMPCFVKDIIAPPAGNNRTD